MVSAQPSKTIIALTISVLAAALATPKTAWAAAGSSSSCVSNTTCTVGEFLYDDDYTPITDPSTECNLTTRYPDGTTLLHDDQLMDASADGWYSYEFTAPTTTGYYRAQVCCTAGTEYLCIDKSFEVQATSGSAPSADDVATAVWGYSGRTLSNFGDLASNIWSSSNRTLSGFGSLVSDIWSNASRTLTGATLNDGKELAIAEIGGNLTDINSTIEENRILLEQLVNKPVIENVIEEEEPDLGKKLDETKNISNQLYINSQYLTSKVGLISSRWSRLSKDELITSLIDLNNVLGDTTDSSSENSLFGQVNWLRDAWKWKEADEVYDQASAIKTAINSAQSSLGSRGKTTSAYGEIKSVVAYLNTLEKLVGDSTDASTASTLFGRIQDTSEIAGVLDQRKSEADSYLASWNTNKNTNNSKKIDELYRNVLSINKIPKASTILLSSLKDISAEKKLKNKLLAIRALIVSNKILLAKGAEASFANTWLEEGSMVFKSLVTNPSTLISQEVPIKYYLPPEIKKEDIIDTDEGLTVQYDAEKDQLYVEGEFTLRPGETRTFSVRVEDIWAVSVNEIESLRKQAEELSKPLEKTSYFAQGVTLKSDIDVSLNKIIDLQDSANTPEQKIRNYREAEIELEAVKVKIDKLQELATEAGSAGTLFGFVGGSQALVVWGLIIVMATGFVFLALYMRVLGPNNKSKAKEKGVKMQKKHTNGKTGGNGKFVRVGKAVAPLIIVAVVTSTITTLIVKASLTASMQKDNVQKEEILSEVPQEEEVLSEQVEEPAAVGGEEIVKVLVPLGSSVNVRYEPSLASEIVSRLTKTTQVVKKDETDDWVLILVKNDVDDPDPIEGWVYADFVEKADEIAVSEPVSGTVVINNNSTGWLRVREMPGGTEIAIVYPEEEYELLDESGLWYQIKLSDGRLDWVSSQYVSVK